MTLSSRIPVRAIRTQLGRKISWAAGIATAVMLSLVTISTIVADVPLRAERGHTFTRQANLITTNLAASLIAPTGAAAGLHSRDGVIRVDTAQLRAALDSYQRLTAIYVVDEHLSVLVSAGRQVVSAAGLIAELKAQQNTQFPPGDDSIAIARTPDSLITAGRILERPGSDGPLVVLEFRTDAHLEIVHGALLGLAAAIIIGLFVWTAIDQLLRHALLAPLLNAARLERRMSRGNWAVSIRSEGSREIQQFLEARRLAVDRAARLWETIQWRVRFLERVTPGKAIEAAHIAGRATPSHRFGRAPQSSVPPLQFLALGVVGVVLLCELAVQLVLMFTLWESIASPLAWFGLGLIAGCGYAMRPMTTRADQTIFVSSVLALASSYLVSALFHQQPVVLEAARLVSGFAIAVCLRLGLGSQVAVESASEWMTRIAYARLGWSAALVAITPVLVIMSMVYEPGTSLSLLAALCAFASCTMWASLAWHRESAPSTASPEAKSYLASAATHPKETLEFRSVLAVFVLAVAITHAVSVCSINTDFSGRFLGLFLMIVALLTGLALPYSFGYRSSRIAVIASALIVVPTTLLYQFTSLAGQPMLLIVLAPALGLMAGCIVSLAGYGEHLRRQASLNRTVTRPAAQRWRRVGILRLGAAFIVAACIQFVVDNDSAALSILGAVAVMATGLIAGIRPVAGKVQ